MKKYLLLLLLWSFSLQVRAAPINTADDPKSSPTYQLGWAAAKTDFPLDGVFWDGFLPGAVTFFTAYTKYERLINIGLQRRLKAVAPEDSSSFKLGYSDYVDYVVLKKVYRGATVGTVAYGIVSVSVSYWVMQFILERFVGHLVVY